MGQSSEVKTEFVACDLCGSFDHDLLFSKIDPVTGQVFHVVQCRCGMAFVNPMPTIDSMKFLYPTDYLEHKDLKKAMYRKMLKLLRNAPGRKLLDVGCGRGEFIHLASQEGWEILGVDSVKWDSACPVPIEVGDLCEMDLEEGTFDAVTAWAVLEHVRKPSSFFERIGRLLKAQGLFVFLVPNIAAPGMRVSCTEDIPRHLWLFSPESVKRYLDKYAMLATSILHNGAIYSAHPFGLLRHAFSQSGRMHKRCADYDNKSVALLRNRQLMGNLWPWLKEVGATLTYKDMLIDLADIALGLLVAQWSKIIRNYGVITVIARKNAAKIP